MKACSAAVSVKIFSVVVPGSCPGPRFRRLRIRHALPETFESKRSGGVVAVNEIGQELRVDAGRLHLELRGQRVFDNSFIELEQSVHDCLASVYMDRSELFQHAGRVGPTSVDRAGVAVVTSSGSRKP